MNENFNPYHAYDGKFTDRITAKLHEPKKKSRRLWKELLSARIDRLERNQRIEKLYKKYCK